MAKPARFRDTIEVVIFTMLGSIISLCTWTSVLAQDKVNLESDLNQQTSTTVSAEIKEQESEPAVDFTLSFVSTFLGQLSGDEGTPNFPYGGAVNLYLSFNGEKVGLWKGLSLDLHFVETFGDSPSTSDSALLPVNTTFVVPRLGGEVRDLAAVLRQKFSNGVIVSFGKYNTFDLLGKAPIVGGGGIDKFMNFGLAARPTTMRPPIFLGGQIQVPLGGGNLNLFVYDPESAQDSDFSISSNGVSFDGRFILPISIGSLQGFQSIGAIYSTQEGSDLRTAPILGEFPPGVSTATKTKGGWMLTYVFQQYLYQNPNNPERNWGIFGDLILTDGNPAPLRWRALVGIAGQGGPSGRDRDRWGVGYFHYGFSNALAENLASQGISIRDENGIEFFYDFAITRHFRLKADLQVVDPIITEADIAVYGGVQTEIKF